MRISESKFHKVWKKEEQNGFTKINLGDSSKNKDGSYTNFTWFGCTLVGDASKTPVDEGDTITVTSAEMKQYKNKDGKYMPTMTIFSFEVTKRGEQKEPMESDGFASFETLDDDCPFL